MEFPASSGGISDKEKKDRVGGRKRIVRLGCGKHTIERAHQTQLWTLGGSESVACARSSQENFRGSRRGATRGAQWLRLN